MSEIRGTLELARIPNVGDLLSIEVGDRVDLFRVTAVDGLDIRLLWLQQLDRPGHGGGP